MDYQEKNDLQEMYGKMFNYIFAPIHMDTVLVQMVNEFRQFLGIARCTLYIIDYEAHEIYSKVLVANDIVEIRLPLDKSSIVGFTALENQLVNILDVYNPNELKNIDKNLKFNEQWDKLSGHKTGSLLSIPIIGNHERKVIGVFQALDKMYGFGVHIEKKIKTFSKVLGAALQNALLAEREEKQKHFCELMENNISDGICISMPNGKIVKQNDVFTKVFGANLNNIQEAVFYVDEFKELFQATCEEGEQKTLKYRYNHGDGNIKIIPFINQSNGHVEKLLTIFNYCHPCDNHEKIKKNIK